MTQETNNTLRREELYQLIWEKPATEIAKDYGISSSMLTRVCRELNIPKPKVGHWAKVAHGKRVRRPALPKLKPGQKESYVINRYQVQAQKSHHQRQRISDEIPDSKRVEEILSGELKTHRWVRWTRAASKKKLKTNEGRLIQDWELRHFDVETSEENFERALGFLNRLLHLAEAEGIKIVSHEKEIPKRKDRWGYYRGEQPDSTGYFLWDGQEIGIRIFEKAKRKEKEDPGMWGNRYEYYGSGQLEFLLLDARGYQGKTEWRDGKRKQIEDSYREMVHCIKRAATEKKEFLIQEDIRKAKEAKIDRMIHAIDRQERMEDSEYERLRQDAAKHAEAVRLRNYAHAALARMSSSPEPGSDQFYWLQWMHLKADELDPLTKHTQPWSKFSESVLRFGDE